MDKLQKWLMQKEAESASLSLAGAEPTRGEKVRFFLRGLRGVKQVPQKSYGECGVYNSPWQRYNPNNSNGNPVPTEDQFKTARKNLAESIRNYDVERRPRDYVNSGVNLPYSRRDFLAYDVENLSEVWRRAGVDGFKIPSEKILEMRRRAIKSKLEEAKERAENVTSIPGVSLDEIERVVDEYAILSRAYREKFDPVAFKKKLIEEYPQRAYTVPVSQVLKGTEGYLVHGLPLSSEKSSLRNNGALKRINNGNMNWEHFLELILEKKPTISCSGVNPNSRSGHFFSGIGAIIGGGQVSHAYSNATVSTVLENGVRLPTSSVRGYDEDVTLERMVARTMNSTVLPGGYNEFIVMGPEITGLYVHPKILDSFSNKTGYDFRRREEALKALDRLVKISQERGIPLYQFEERKGFIPFDKTQLEKVA